MVDVEHVLASDAIPAATPLGQILLSGVLVTAVYAAVTVILIRRAFRLPAAGEAVPARMGVA